MPGAASGDRRGPDLTIAPPAGTTPAGTTPGGTTPGGPSPSDALPAPENRVPRWIAYLFASLAVILVPAAARVIADAPPLLRAANWRLAWGGFDVGLAIMLAATGVALLRRSSLAANLAAATAALLGCDAWLDTLSSASMGAGSLLTSAAEAVFVELPLMTILIWVALGPARRAATAQATPRPRWLPVTFIVLALALGPWIVWLFLSLPNTVAAAHWDVTRAGFTIALAALLAASAVALFRHWASARLLTAMTAALLIRDAWFNTLTAAKPVHAGLALLVAVLIELPLAALCAWVSVRQADGLPSRRPLVPVAGPPDISQPIPLPDLAAPGPEGSVRPGPQPEPVRPGSEQVGGERQAC